MFAESDQQRKIRLRALELVEDRSEGQRNDFMRAMENAETGLHMEALGRSTEEKKEKKKDKEDSTKSIVSFLLCLDENLHREKGSTFGV